MRFRPIVAGLVVAGLALSCADDPDQIPLPGDTALSSQTNKTVSQAAVDGARPAPTVPQATSYRLRYRSTCGDGPHFTEGTEIEVHDQRVKVTGGEEPWTIGSLATWAEFATAAHAEGRTVDVQLDVDGRLQVLSVQGLGIDDEFCIDVENFEVLPD